VEGSNVIFDWDEPIANGTPITGYIVYIRKSDLSYVTNTAVCNGLNSVVMQNTRCTVPLSKLITSPFNLLKGYSIFIKVVATNAYGNSIISEPGNGGVIVLVPDAPRNLANNPSLTSNSIISFTWSDGASDGGTPILDYRITYD